MDQRMREGMRRCWGSGEGDETEGHDGMIEVPVDRFGER